MNRSNPSSGGVRGRSLRSNKSRNVVRETNDDDDVVVTETAHASSSSDVGDAPLPTGSGEINDNNGGGGGMGGIDAFLQRLDDDVDLKKMKKKRRGGGGGGLPPPSSSSGDDYEFDSSSSSTASNSSYPSSIVKRTFIAILVVVALFLAHDARTSPPDRRIVGGSRFINDFLLWVKVHPGSGAAAFVLVYGACVVFLLPLGTPLTLGGGYVYKVSYGWAGGLFMGTAASTLGSLLGSCSAFLLGRHVMRDRVRRWGRRHPLFDAIDLAVSDNGFRIMCLLYLTPILPLGPVSYVCGTTSMPLAKFAMAKIAAVPLMLLYTFIGASTDTFFSAAVSSSSYSATTKDGDGNNVDSSGAGGGGTAVDGVGGRKGVGVDEETHGKMVLFGLVLSVVSMSLVSHFVKKELYKIFDKQKREKSDDDDNGVNDRQYRRNSSSNNAEEQHVEMRRRPRGQAGTIDGGRADSTVDEEKG